MKSVLTRKLYLALGALNLCALVLGVLVFAQKLEARQFRSINPIASPENVPNGAEVVQKLRPVKPEIVRRAVYAIAKAYNTGQLDPLLNEEKFFDKTRLLDVITEEVPRDAKLKILSVNAIRTQQQYFMPKNGRQHQISIVSAVVSTQLEFTDPAQGFIRLDGRNEFIIEIDEKRIN